MVECRKYFRLGTPTPGPSPVRNQAAQQELSSRQVSKAPLICTAAQRRSHYCLSSTTCQVSGSIRQAFSWERKSYHELHAEGI